MAKHILISIFLFFFSTVVFSQTWYGKEKKGMYGYVDSLGATKIPFEYPFIFDEEFTDSIVFVGLLENGICKIKTIDRRNRKLFTVFTQTYGPDEIEEGLFRIQDDNTGNIGFADMNGKVIITPRFFHVDSFSDGLAAFNTGGRHEQMDEEHTLVVGGKWGYIDKTGKEIFPAIFDRAYPFEDGKAKVRIGENIFCIKKCNH